ncbi:MAG: hypothetical protein EB039_15340 [Proteobacteria bacterium]|nr:hypothetical protein [Pseudomonadota bacterium]
MTLDPDTSGPSPFGGSRIQALDEDPILIACALRFDGWKYIERMGFDHVGACEAFITTGAPFAPASVSRHSKCLGKTLPLRVWPIA